MRLECPACGKNNETESSAVCSRCGCDLGRIEKARQAALWRLTAAAQSLRDRRWTAALRHAEIGWSLRHTALAARLAFLAAIALRDTRRAVHWQQAANANGGKPEESG